MDRRIKAILVANEIYDLASVEIIDYEDGVLEIVKDDETQYISLEGRVYIEDIDEQIEEIKQPFEIKTQDEKIDDIIKETKDSPIKVTVTTIAQDIDDDLFNGDEKIDDDIDNFDIDLDDDFNFEDEVNVVEKVEETPKEVKPPKINRKSKKKGDDNLINLL